MAKRIVKGTVVVLRKNPKKDGENIRVVPPVGQAFDFTADEIKDFDRITPGALVKLTAEDEPDDNSPVQPAEAEPSAQAPEKGNKKPIKKDEDDL